MEDRHATETRKTSPSKSFKQAGERECALPRIPVEILEYIVHFATSDDPAYKEAVLSEPWLGDQDPRYTRRGEAIITHIVCRSVCRRWRDLLPAPSADQRERFAPLAARKGWLNILRWAQGNGCTLSSAICSKAAEGGHLDVIMWARENECTWDHETCRAAAFQGDIKVLKWVREQGCPWNGSICEVAAKYHPEVLKWARENGCLWDELTCASAAGGGRLEVLKWARENGCPWSTNTCR